LSRFVTIPAGYDQLAKDFTRYFLNTEEMTPLFDVAFMVGQGKQKKKLAGVRAILGVRSRYHFYVQLYRFYYFSNKETRGGFCLNRVEFDMRHFHQSQIIWLVCLSGCFKRCYMESRRDSDLLKFPWPNSWLEQCQLLCLPKDQSQIFYKFPI
jgi:hypothetical protein